MSEENRPTEVTRILQSVVKGDEQAAAELLPVVYAELRRLADSWMAKVPAGQTLQPTALVHEVYVRLVGAQDPGWESRRHFFFAAARAMRDILVEQGRRKATLKRGGGRKRVDVDRLVVAIDAPADDILALDEALKRLQHDDERKHRIVLLRFFAGLTAKDTAEVLELSLRTVEREWRYIRARLHKELSEDGTSRTGQPGSA